MEGECGTVPALTLTIVNLDNPGISPSRAHPATGTACVGVDIGGSKVLAARLSAGGEVEAVDRLPTPHSAAEIVEVVLTVAGRVFPDAGPAPPRPSAWAARGWSTPGEFPSSVRTSIAWMASTSALSWPSADLRGQPQSSPTTPRRRAGRNIPWGRRKGTTMS